MEGLLIVVVLGATVLVGTTIGRRYSVAPPVLLIVFGGLLGLIPEFSEVRLPSDVVLLLFLPAILYWESLNTSLREIRSNLRVIILSAVVLVIVTMVGVSYTLQGIGVAASAAWILGAVLAPTDAAAVAGLAKRMPRRALTTLRAESLVNDGTALVLFAVAVGALVDGHVPGPALLVGELVWSSVGAVLVGVVVGYAVVLVRRYVDDPQREGGLSILTPFLAFLVAEVVHTSGVVAVVVAGLVLSWAGPRVIRARSRLETYSFWDLGTFMLNGSLFVLVGVQFPAAVRGIVSHSVGHAVWIALVTAVAVIGIRLAWSHVAAMVIRLVDRRAVQRTRRVNWKVRTASGWAGFRGAVSLAAALAVPATLDDGSTYADRDLIVFVTSVVIVVTVLVQGLTLPMVVRWAGLTSDEAREVETRNARIRATEVALAALPDIAIRFGAPGEVLDRIRADYQGHLDQLRAEGTEHAVQAWQDQVDRRVRLEVLDRKRRAVTAMRDDREIDDIVLRDLQASMDIEEVRLLGPAPTD
ncbi:monovalent cation:H+ antiporter, CPA1 family [Asanoa hainanensis]|uniref:Monovalent cation:H+ antiporter, CPA1 family n=1 Tax=Asanoa hainanensis TaxID=560556 RepID=A0A239P871_9ACTN|nr:Na+/H+ antiporter [Asanoa hainanensis]SNT63215.1 monovalent cation:H+ antiporter, CPA1 family [Asanoa hainanensis]